MADLFDVRPRLADDVRLRETAEGPLLVRRRPRRALLLSEDEATAVSYLDGSTRLGAVAGRVLEAHGRVSYAGLVHLVQALAVRGFLASPIPSLGVLAPPARLRWVFDLPLLMVPGVGAAAPRLPERLLSAPLLVLLPVLAIAFALPHLGPIFEDPAAVATVGGSWEVAVLALFTVGFLATSLRGVARAAWLRGQGVAAPAAGLRLRAGIVVLDVDDQEADLRAPGQRERMGRAGWLGLCAGALAVALAGYALPHRYDALRPAAALPLLLAFLELYPLLPTDGARLVAPDDTPAARRRLTGTLLRGPWWRAALRVFVDDRRTLLSSVWVLGALLLAAGPLAAGAASWWTHLRHSESLPLRVAGALPVIAWGLVTAFALATAAVGLARLGLLAIEVRRGRRMPAPPPLPDMAARRLLLGLPPLALQPDARREALERALLVRVASEGERIDDDPDALYVVETGLFQLEADREPLVRLRPGDVFAPRAPLGPPDASRAMVALRRGRLLVVPGTALAALLDGQPEGRGALLDDVAARALIRAAPVFSHLRAQDVDRLVAGADRLHVAPGEALVEAGRVDRSVYVLVEGRLEGRGHEPVPAVTRAGDLLGLEGLLDGAPRRLGWVAVEPSTVLQVPWRALSQVLAGSASLGLALETLVAHDPWGRARGPVRIEP